MLVTFRGHPEAERCQCWPAWGPDSCLVSPELILTLPDCPMTRREEQESYMGTRAPSAPNHILVPVPSPPASAAVRGRAAPQTPIHLTGERGPLHVRAPS